MTPGTKSVLFGAHQFLLHPLFVALAWWKLFGPPLDLRLWFAFFIHDLGYLGKRNLDGPEGETHPEPGAKIMEKLFGKKWGELCRYHSRSLARKAGVPPSLLSYADKYATALYPRWLYLTQVKATGEVREYLQHFFDSLQNKGKYAHQPDTLRDKATPSGIAHGSLDHWYWAITRRYNQEWLRSKQQELQPELQAFFQQHDRRKRPEHPDARERVNTTKPTGSG